MKRLRMTIKEKLNNDLVHHLKLVANTKPSNKTMKQ